MGRNVQRYVAALVVIGTAVGLALLVVVPPAWPPAIAGAVWPAVVLTVAAIAINLGAISFRDTGDEGAAHSLDEIVVVAALVLLAGPWPWVLMVSTAIITQLVRRQDALRGLFNVSWYSISGAVAVFAYLGFGAEDPFGATGLLAAAVALAAYSAVNWVALAGVKVCLGLHRDLWTAMVDGKLHVTVKAATAAGALGVLAAFLLRTAPHLALLLAVPLLLIRERSAAAHAAEEARREDHRRLERTVAGASDGIVLIDGQDRIAVWNEAMTRLTGIPTDRALGRAARSVLALEPLTEPPVGTEATHRIEARNGEHRLVAAERSPVELSAHEAGTVVLVRDVTSEAEIVMLREDLISRVSHELRTPLTSVNGLLQTVTSRWDELEEGARLALLRRALGAGQRLSRLIDGLLARGRIDHGAGQPERVVTRLDDVIDAVVDELAVSFDLDIVRARAPVDALVDVDHLHQILVVLIENAVRYGGAPVEVTTTAGHGVAHLVVRDHGDGVPEAFQPHLFVPFSQASTGLRRTASGLGLGLSIARELAEVNGGGLTHRTPAGGGASFELTLPLATTSADRGRA
jgi:PAS domain S-box-containing protein